MSRDASKKQVGMGIILTMLKKVGKRSRKISDIISKIGSSQNKITQFQVKTGDEVTRTVTDQNIAVTNTKSGLTKDIKVEKSQEGNTFSIKK